MATLRAFDTLAYTKSLVEKGYERDKAEALAEAQREFFVKELEHFPKSVKRFSDKKCSKKQTIREFR